MDMFSNSAQFASSSSSIVGPLMQGTMGEGAAGIMHPQEYSHTMIQPLSQPQTQVTISVQDFYDWAGIIVFFGLCEGLELIV